MQNITMQKVDNSIEKMIITGMIVSEQFLKEVQTIYSPEFIIIPFAKTIAAWCVDYYKKYQKAPGKHIQDIFNAHSQNSLGEDQAELIKSFLMSISHEHERANQFNVDYLLSQAEIRFKECDLKNLADDINAYLSQGKVKEAEELIIEHKRIERPQSKGVNPLTNRELLYKAIEKREQNILFNLPDTLGRFIGPIERSSFIAVLGPEKRGKSFILLQLAMWAIGARCNVAFFEIGDMTESDVARRLAINNTRTSDKHYGDVLVPVLDCLYNQRNECIKKERMCDIGILHRKQAEGEEYNKDTFEDAPNYKSCTVCQNTREFKGAVWYKKESIPKLTWKNAWEMGKKTMQRARNKEFKLIAYPNDSVSIRDIDVQLDYWEQTENFIPDVIIIDYADNLAALNPKLDERWGSQNKTWKTMRALSQKRFCAVITATQSDADSYDQKSLKERNFSEDKRKYAHVTSFITLNQTPEEKDAGIMRIGRMFVREDRFNIKHECTILQCLDIGKPYLDSFI